MLVRPGHQGLHAPSGTFRYTLTKAASSCFAGFAELGKLELVVDRLEL
jgi:hypothetical protein